MHKQFEKDAWLTYEGRISDAKYGANTQIPVSWLKMAAHLTQLLPIRYANTQRPQKTLIDIDLNKTT